VGSFFWLNKQNGILAQVYGIKGFGWEVIKN